nr:immunoglobulin light chain junction region [Macaca mulatta]MOW62126.1 immunoglobulin light chain junction region [Macaca mulatta]MOW62183.1 immunoglobulin light chain junction region [Macaca mulatta]MOW62752.1 immunoglobulin light chain junction region [Macaca mulatta]MOW62895.1 immunoglobulin light chain junction region [Macaca mulatta]
CQHTYDTPFTF